MSDVRIWGYAIPEKLLTENEKEYLLRLPEECPSVEWVWNEMDLIWDAFALNNKQSLEDQPVGNFYAHPVWLMNGIYTFADSISRQHRVAIANYLSHHNLKAIVDYGGGFGELATTIASCIPDSFIDIIEPYPSRVARERIKGKGNIKFLPKMSGVHYDAAIAQDVLEHVADPILLANEIASRVKEGGIIIFANCFYPVIKCHLPGTFYLRFTFPAVMTALGLRYIGRIENASHAQVYVRMGKLKPFRGYLAARISAVIGPLINLMHEAMLRVKVALLRNPVS